MTDDWKTEDVLRAWYWDRGMSTKEIADKVGVADVTVSYWMEKKGVERRNKNPSLEDRFWSNVDKGSEGDCWEWCGASDSDGYGMMQHNGDSVGVHRVSWMIHYSDPDDEYVLHHCDNRSCVNPDHLFLGDQSDNIEDMWNKGRQVIPMGEDSGSAKLSRDDVKEIKRKLDRETHSDLADEYGVSTSTVSMISSGENWSHVEVDQ